MHDTVYGMTPERYDYIFNTLEEQLTLEERQAGWYFSSEYDGLLVNRHWPGHELTDEEWGED